MGYDNFPRRNALASLTGPAPTMGGPMGNAMASRAARLTAAGYEGPMPGTQELRDARAAGEHPIFDWRREHGFPGFGAGAGWDGTFGAGQFPGWAGGGWHPHTQPGGQPMPGAPAAPTPRPMNPAFAYGEPYGSVNALASFGGGARRPIPLVRR